MKRRTVYLFWSIYGGAALLCQWFLPDFPVAFFAFPVNAALVLLLVVGLWILFKEGNASIRLLLTPSTTFILLGALFATCLATGLVGRPSPSSWWYVALMSALIAHLYVVLLQGYLHPHPHRRRFLLVHGGLLLALLGGFAGSADTQEWRLVVRTDEPTTQAVNAAHEQMRLPHALQLKKFEAEFYANGTPQTYRAMLTTDEPKDIVLEVNHPYPLTWMENLYLVDYEHTDHPRYCIVQLVRQPWKYIQEAGIWLLLAGSVLLFAQATPRMFSRRKEEKKDDME